LIFAFGNFELDEGLWELRRDGVRVSLQPKTLSLLFYLVRARDRAVSKDELLQRVWPEAVVTESSLNRTVSLARLAVGDRGAQPVTIQTVARRGYRFVAPVRVLSGGVAAAAPEDRDGRSYVGRDELRARLARSLDAALAGRGRILLLAGEAGIGKTRTAELLVARARAAGAEVAAAWGVDSAAAPTFWAWTRIVRVLAAASGRALPALLAGAAKPVARLLPDARDADGAPLPFGVSRVGEAERFRLFEAVHTFLARCAARHSLVLVLDDLHSLDPESLRLLEFLGHELEGLPIAVIATSREQTGHGEPERARARERLSRLTVLEQWPLTGLSEAEASDFVRSRSDVDPPHEMVAALVHKTGGNPLLLDAIVRSLASRQLLRSSMDVADWEALLPEGIRPLLAQRLEGLSQSTRAMLGCAALIGQDCAREVLAQALDRDVDLESCIREAEQMGFLVASGAHPLRFAHALIRESLLEALTPIGNDRRALHARIAGALENASAGSDDGIAERARHACDAVPLFQAARAAELARRAGLHAARFQDPEDAASWYERALEMRKLAGVTDPAMEAEIHLGLAAARSRVVGLEHARRLYRRVFELAESAAREDLVALAALGFADRPDAGGACNAEVVAVLEAALGRGLASEPIVRTRILSRLAAELRYVDRPRAEALIEEALHAARGLGDAAALAQALDDSTFVRFSPDDPEGWVALNQAVVRAARDAGDPELELAGYAGWWTGLLELGDLSRVDRVLVESETATAALRTPLARWLREAARAMRALLDGRLADAEARILASLQHAERAQSPSMDLQALVQLVYLRVEQGRAHEIEAATRSQMQRFPDTPAWRSALAALLAAAGRLDEARHEIARLAREDFTDVPRDRGWLPTLAFAAEVAHAIGDADLAERLHRALSPYARLCVVAGSLLFYGSVSHHLGLLAATRARDEDALVHFDAALDVHERIGARPWSARTQLAMAELLARRGSAGDAERAADLATAALSTARALGLERTAASARRFDLPRLRAVPRG
jgi:DNA-binding winged helix-turn-helix (wHTH) protein/RecA/RadA recombinase/tetratricopeptide (TPR) repeat protein